MISDFYTTGAYNSAINLLPLFKRDTTTKYLPIFNKKNEAI